MSGGKKPGAEFGSPEWQRRVGEGCEARLARVATVLIVLIGGECPATQGTSRAMELSGLYGLSPPGGAPQEGARTRHHGPPARRGSPQTGALRSTVEGRRFPGV